jgi:hypothetical protein
MKNLTKWALPLVITGVLITSCKTQKKEETTKLVLTNTSNLKLTDKAISIKRNLFGDTSLLNKFPLLIASGDTIPSQINDTNQDGNWDELFIVANFSENEKKVVTLKWIDNVPEFNIRTSVRFGKRLSEKSQVQPAIEEILQANEVYSALGFQRYQTDGPTWENDKVGFRHYLDGRNAKDVFGKKIPQISPENVGIDTDGAVEDNYHVMHDWGRDVFPVGNSVGLGGFALLVDNEINRLGIISGDTLNNIETTTFKILNEGPENSVLNYHYKNWKVTGNLYQANETTSIWPGMYGYKNTISIDGLKGNEKLLIGLSNINNEKGLNTFEVGDWVCLIQHDNLTYEREWVLGTALIVPKNGFEGAIEAPKTGQLTNSYLAKFKVENNVPISYYAVAGWELSADKNFKDAAYFTNYVTNLAKQLAAEVSVEISKN